VILLENNVFAPGDCNGSNSAILALKKKWTHVVLQMTVSIMIKQYFRAMALNLRDDKNVKTSYFPFECSSLRCVHLAEVRVNAT
jgi:hypothetical protein